MKRLAALTVFLLALCASSQAQTPANRLRYGPTTVGIACNPATGDVFKLSVAPYKVYHCTGPGVWSEVGGGVADHGALTGLSDDDHPQYLTVTRGDARYYTQAALDTLFSGKANTSHTHAIADTTGLQAALDAKATAASVTSEASARAAADALLQPLSEKNQNNGYAGLDGSGLVPDIRLPSSIARDSEVTSAVAAEATARDTAISTASTADRARGNHTGTQTLSTISDAGTAASRNVAASGNASTSEVVKGDDTRLTDSRTPTAHASTHASAGSDPVTLAQSQVANLPTDLAGKAASVHTHAEADVTGLVADLAGKQATDVDLDALAALSSTGLITRTGTGAVAARTVTAGSAKITITNGNGVSGNPTVDLGTVTASDVGLSSVVNATQARVLCVYANSTGSGNSGTSETDLGTTCTISAGTLSAGKIVQIRAVGTLANTGNNKTGRIYFGGTAVTVRATGAGTSGWYADAEVTVTGASTQVSYGRGSMSNGSNELVNGVEITAPAENTANAIVVKVTGQSSAASNDIILKSFRVMLLN